MISKFLVGGPRSPPSSRKFSLEVLTYLETLDMVEREGAEAALPKGKRESLYIHA